MGSGVTVEAMFSGISPYLLRSSIISFARAGLKGWDRLNSALTSSGE